MQLEGKAAIVTGAGSGVGQATAIRLAELGADVLVNYNRTKDGAEQTAADIQRHDRHALTFQADVRDDAQVREMVDVAMGAFGRLDVLVNNAGTTEFIPFDRLEDVTDDSWRRLLDVNLLGPFHCTRAAAPVIKDTAGGDGGEIVMVSSIAGVLGIGSSIPYCASKAALNNMTMALARTLAPRVRVNAVAPGFITGRWLKDGLGEEKYETIKQGFESKLPLQRVCTPDDVAAAINRARSLAVIWSPGKYWSATAA